MESEKKVFDLHKFVESNIAFNDPTNQELSLYLLTQGLKERNFAAQFAFSLDKYFDKRFEELFASTETKVPTPRKKEAREKEKTFDVVIQDKNGNPLHVIELKQERHSKFVEQAKRFDSEQKNKVTNIAKNKDRSLPGSLTSTFNLETSKRKKGQIEIERTLRDIQPWYKVLGDIDEINRLGFPKYYPNTKFYSGIILMSFHSSESLGHPTKYMNYSDDEKKSRKVEFKDISDLRNECESNVAFIKERLVEQIETLNFMKSPEIDQIQHTKIAEGTHRSVFVRGDFIFFELEYH